MGMPGCRFFISPQAPPGVSLRSQNITQSSETQEPRRWTLPGSLHGPATAPCCVTVPVTYEPALRESKARSEEFSAASSNSSLAVQRVGGRLPSLLAAAARLTRELEMPTLVLSGWQD